MILGLLWYEDLLEGYPHSTMVKVGADRINSGEESAECQCIVEGCKRRKGSDMEGKRLYWPDVVTRQKTAKGGDFAS